MVGWPGNGSGPSSQPSNSAPSSEHSNSPGSLDEKTNAALVLVVVCSGPDSIVVSGRFESVVQLHSSGVVSRIPSGVIETTSSMCSPSVSPLTTYGDGQGSNTPRSIAHSKLEPLTVESKRNDAVPPMISAS